MVRPLVEVSNICKHYAVGRSLVHAVSGVSLSIRKGEFVSILGRSGSGKTTLMNLLGLLERPDSGAYWLRGQEVGGLSERTRAMVRNRDVGFVFQLPTLLARSSALDNVALPLAYAGIRNPERQARAKEALDRVGLSHRSQHWPSQLSGGEQQRVAIARAIVNRPALLLADEPTGALDSQTSAEILALLKELHRDGATIVVVTHAADVAARTSRRIALHDGRIVADPDGATSASLLRAVGAGGRA